MPFESDTKINQYLPSPPPVMEGGDREYLQRELRRISAEFNKLLAVTNALQDFMNSGEVVVLDGFVRWNGSQLRHNDNLLTWKP